MRITFALPADATPRTIGAQCVPRAGELVALDARRYRVAAIEHVIEHDPGALATKPPHIVVHLVELGAAAGDAEGAGRRQ